MHDLRHDEDALLPDDRLGDQRLLYPRCMHNTGHSGVLHHLQSVYGSPGGEGNHMCLWADDARLKPTVRIVDMFLMQAQSSTKNPDEELKPTIGS